MSDTHNMFEDIHVAQKTNMSPKLNQLPGYKPSSSAFFDNLTVKEAMVFILEQQGICNYVSPSCISTLFEILLPREEME